MICRCLHMCSRRNKLPRSTWYVITASRLTLQRAVKAFKAQAQIVEDKACVGNLKVCSKIKKKKKGTQKRSRGDGLTVHTCSFRCSYNAENISNAALNMLQGKRVISVTSPQWHSAPFRSKRYNADCIKASARLQNCCERQRADKRRSPVPCRLNET